MHNILYISSFGSLKGGGQRSLYLLIKYLDRQKFRPYLIVPDKDELSEEVEKLGAKVFILPFPRVRSFAIFLNMRSFFRLCKIVRKENISIIHTDAPRETVYAFLAARLYGRKVIFHARVSDSFLWLDKILYYLADRIIAVSSAVAGRFGPVNRKKKIRIVYNSVELDVFRPLNGAEERREKFVIGYFGRIDRRKCIETVINAVKNIKGEIELVIMGQGDQLYLEELKRLADDDRIKFRLYKNDIVEDISEVDAVVLPSSKGEGMPRIIIEAMALGKATIVSNVPPHNEILGEELKDLIFPVRDELKLKEIIERLQGDRFAFFRQRELMRKKAEELFDVRKNTKKIEGIYEECVIDQAS